MIHNVRLVHLVRIVSRLDDQTLYNKTMKLNDIVRLIHD